MCEFSIDYKTAFCIYKFAFYDCPLLLEDVGQKVYVFKKTELIKEYIKNNLDKEIVDCPSTIRDIPELSLSGLLTVKVEKSFIHLSCMVIRKHSGDSPKGETKSLYNLFYLNRPSQSLKLFAWIRKGMCYSLDEKNLPDNFSIKDYLKQEEPVEDAKWGRISFIPRA